MNQQSEDKFDGPCDVCGQPGYVQQIPGVPVSGCFCDEHAPTGPPIISLLFNLITYVIVFSVIGWLIYIFFIK